MRRYGVLLLLAIVALIVALKSQPNPPALALAPQDSATPTETPTIGILLPLVQNVGQSFLPGVANEPTNTPIPTATFTPTVTPTPFNCNGRFDGSISLIPKSDGSTTYATYIELVHILQWVHNNNGQTTCFGILGYNMIGPGGTGPYPFNSQWAAGGVASKYLTIYANCWGPYGQPCAGSQGSGQQVDTSIGTHPNYIINQPGAYTVYYMVCYSNFNVCTQKGGGGDWHQLGVIQFTAVNWTPSAPSGTEAAPLPQSPAEPLCFLVTDDPGGIYLNCDYLHLKERQLFQH